PRRIRDAGDGECQNPKRVDRTNPALLDPAEGAARSRPRLERNRSAGAYARTGVAEPGLHLADRARLFGDDSARGDPAQYPGEPSLVHGLHAVSARDQP